jgi:hypothetical protein
MKPRSGKSFIMAFYIIRCALQTSLYITPYPSETRDPIRRLFNRYVEFKDYCVVVLGTDPIPVNTKNTIFIASKQYLDKHIDDKLPIFDAVFWDEVQYAALTPNARMIVDTHITPDTQVIRMSGTAEKVKRTLGIPSSQIFIWQLEHESYARNGDFERLYEIYGEDFKTACIETYGETSQIKCVRSTRCILN